MKVRVTSLAHNPIEVAGAVFRPRTSVEVDLKPDQLATVKAHRRLVVEERRSKTTPVPTETG